MANICVQQGDKEVLLDARNMTCKEASHVKHFWEALRSTSVAMANLHPDPVERKRKRIELV